MEKINYKLPAKALEILQELADICFNRMMYYSYADSCCLTGGYDDASDFFHQKSRDYRFHQRWIAKFLISRGEEVEVNATEKPKIDSDEFKDILEMSLKEEVKIAAMLNESVIELQKVDVSAADEVKSLYSGQRCIMDELNAAWTSLNADEDVYEFQKSYFASKTTENIPVG